MDAHLWRLLAWSALSIPAGCLSLFRKTEFWRGIGTLTIGWSVVNLLIVAGGLQDHSNPSLYPTREFLAFNLGLNIAYISAGAVLMLASPKDRAFARGAGLAVIIQGLALLALDGFLLSRLPPEFVFL